MDTVFFNSSINAHHTIASGIITHLPNVLLCLMCSCKLVFCNIYTLKIVHLGFIWCDHLQFCCRQQFANVLYKEIIKQSVCMCVEERKKTAHRWFHDEWRAGTIQKGDQSEPDWSTGKVEAEISKIRWLPGGKWENWRQVRSVPRSQLEECWKVTPGEGVSVELVGVCWDVTCDERRLCAHVRWLAG